MKYYIGITVGPIFDTILDATTPAQLWFASTMFSDITRRLCKAITDELGGKIFSPFYDENDADGLKDGAGKYHDRIIFRSETDLIENTLSTLNEIIAGVKNETVTVFGKEIFGSGRISAEEARSFLNDYLFIEYAVFEEGELCGENCILKISPYLDALELMKTSPSGMRKNPFSAMFSGNANSKNEFIKLSKLITDLGDEAKRHLLKSDNVRSIEEISGHSDNRDNRKYKNYYCVVNADGDSMGNFLKTIGGDTDKLTAFSKACLNYATQATQMIAEFGGMPIYAGGDDLLFLAPVMGNDVNGDGRTALMPVFELCKRISDAFVNAIKGNTDYQTTPTLSFGISIQYFKYPLYEALRNSGNALHSAKQVKKDEPKNRTAIRLEKHSGQSVSVIVGNENLESFANFVWHSFDEAREDEAGKTIKSIKNKIMEFETIIDECDKLYGGTVLKTGDEHYPWDNLFDNIEQKKSMEYVRRIQRWYYNEVRNKEKPFRLIDGNETGAVNSGSVKPLISALAIAKFLIERGNEND